MDEYVNVDQDIRRVQDEVERLKGAGLWHPLTHDRRIELVFIGDRRMQEDAIRAAVEGAMLTQEELGDFLGSWDAEAGAETEASPGTERALNPFADVPGPARGGSWYLE